VIDSISILIIEGDPALRIGLASALSEAGFATASVPDYSESLLKLKPDMIIIDETLPGGDGMEACFQLHSTLGIPVILFGKDSSGEAWKAAVEAGADFYFTNSFNRRVLAATVKAILRRYGRSTRGNGRENRNKGF